MKKQEIMDAIVRKMGGTSYGIWTVGVTDDPARRKTEHGDPKYWTHWDADSEKDARDIEEHFLKKGMKGGGGGPGRANYVYVF